jgi:tripartite-type tricarboxylate transporter receptor subunit TctC
MSPFLADSVQKSQKAQRLISCQRRGGLGAPKNTPTEIVDKLNKEINAGLADPTVKSLITNLGSVPMPMTSANFAKFIADETDKWANVINFAGIEPL